MTNQINKNYLSLIFIVFISLFLSISYSIDQQATDGGLVISGLIRYPDDLSIMKTYYFNLYSFLHQFSSFLLKIDLTPINTSRFILFLSTLFYFLGIYLVVRSITSSTVIALLVGLTILIFRKNFGNVDYPTLMFSDLTFSMMALSIVTLIYGLISNKNFFLIGFFSIFCVSIHPIIGLWIIFIVTLSLTIHKFFFKNIILHKNLIYGSIIGFFALFLSLFIYFQIKLDIDQFISNQNAYDTYIENWDSHRIVVEDFLSSLHYPYIFKSIILIFCCAICINHFNKIKKSYCALTLTAVFISALISLFIYFLYKLNPNLFPGYLTAINPTRFVLMHSVIGIPIIISTVYILIYDIQKKNNFNFNYSKVLILIILLLYSISHYKNILIRTESFFTNLQSDNKEDIFWQKISELNTTGYIVTSSDWTYYHVLRKSRKPVLLNIGLMDMIPYLPYTADRIKKIIENVYGIPFDNPPNKNVLKIPKEIVKTNFENKTTNDWNKLSKDLKIEYIITPKNWDIKLNLKFTTEKYSIYKI